MKLTSSAFVHGATIPKEYSCDGGNNPPVLKIADVPKMAKSLVLIMEDPDASKGTFVHWLVWNIAPESPVLSKKELTKYFQGKNSAEKIGYLGPCPPHGTHRYVFKLYALDTALTLQPGAMKQHLVAAMAGHVVEQAELLGTYTR
ncbi:MAG TPA: YbhB/YbcL family Raf kinase inhibitor-like protein [Candidatus Thermoplasmatota archaeon]|nr:YbhB/YbcL family Raf kinase inhibitor-like protein [Candidatus Thermoplasmatota archaeon]